MMLGHVQGVLVSFLLVYVKDLGASAVTLGVIVAENAIAEVFFFFFSGKLFSNHVIVP